MKNKLTLKRITLLSIATLTTLVLVAFFFGNQSVEDGTAATEMVKEELEAVERETLFIGNPMKLGGLIHETDTEELAEEIFAAEIGAEEGNKESGLTKLTDGRVIVVKLPENAGKVNLEQNLLKRTISVEISTDAAIMLTPDDIYRIQGEKAVSGGIDPTGNDIVNNISMIIDDSDRSEIIFETNEYLLAEGKVVDHFYVITLKRPDELYDKIVVVDAGHGGKDPGARAADKKTWESNVNLAVLLKLKEMMDENPDVMVFYTRTDDSYPTLDERVNLANGVNADMFISIHCNSSESSKLNGSEVLYNRNQGIENPFNSKELAMRLEKGLSTTLDTDMRGIYAADDIRIVRLSEVPVALVETCYLSNKKDLAKIKSDEGQQAVAEMLYNQILSVYELKENR